MRPARRCGTLAPVVALGGILLATLLDPTFSWTADALSDLGVREASAPVFNGALVAGGALGLGYAPALWAAAGDDAGTDDDAGSRLAGRAVVPLFAAATVAMAGVGLFPIGSPLHAPAALAFYLLFTLAMAVDGLARRRSAAGRAALLLAGVHVAVWALWIAGLRPGPGLALPEFAGALLLAAWMWRVGPAPAAPGR